MLEIRTLFTFTLYAKFRCKPSSSNECETHSGQIRREIEVNKKFMKERGTGHPGKPKKPPKPIRRHTWIPHLMEKRSQIPLTTAFTKHRQQVRRAAIPARTRLYFLIGRRNKLPLHHKVALLKISSHTITNNSRHRLQGTQRTSMRNLDICRWGECPHKKAIFHSRFRALEYVNTMFFSLACSLSSSGVRHLNLNVSYDMERNSLSVAYFLFLQPKIGYGAHFRRSKSKTTSTLSPCAEIVNS